MREVETQWVYWEICGSAGAHDGSAVTDRFYSVTVRSEENRSGGIRCGGGCSSTTSGLGRYVDVERLRDSHGQLTTSSSIARISRSIFVEAGRPSSWYF